MGGFFRNALLFIFRLLRKKKAWGAPRLISSTHLGMGWAGNTINTAIFRGQGLFSMGGDQFGAFYVNKNKIRVFKRNLISGGVEFFDLCGDYNICDAHNSISLGVDRSGFLHICYDQHASKLRYRRSILPGAISDWTDELEMTSRSEECMTYPYFVLPKNGSPLRLLYRDGGPERGQAKLKTFDEMACKWEDFSCSILNGVGQKPWTCNGYWNTPVQDDSGSVHLGFVWRTYSLGTDALINNVNVCYAKLPAQELYWLTAAGVKCKLPITPVNCEVAFPSPPGGNLINQSGMAIDSSGFPHIVYYSNDSGAIPQYQYLYYDGKAWCHHFISARSEKFLLAGKGTLRIPMSRPEIVVSRKGGVYCVFRADISFGRLAVAKLMPPRFEINLDDIFYITDYEVGYSEPVIDRERWLKDEILSIFVQRSDQPNNEGVAEDLVSDVSVVDICF